MTFNKKNKRLWVLLSIALISVLGLAACSDSAAEGNETAQITSTVTEKSLLEQAVDWCNSNLFEHKNDYEIFTHELKTFHDREYDFLIKQEASGNYCELYYIQCEGEQLKKVLSCGAGDKSLFSYDIVNIHGEDYVAVYCAYGNYKGDLKLFPLNDIGIVYTIEDAINYNRDLVAVDDEYSVSYNISRFFEDGKLNAEYRDLNYDELTDIKLTGYICEYIQYPWDDSPELANKIEYTRTYHFDSKEKQFVLKDEKKTNVYMRYPSVFDYTGYMDVHPGLAKNNPQFDYDGDGLLDRIYKEINPDTLECSFYVHFGNGKKLLLADHAYGFFYKTMAADLTGDGMNEIIFEQLTTSTKSDIYFYSIASYNDGEYKLMDIPYFLSEYESEADGKLYLPLSMNKVEADKVSIYQPDSGYRSFITTVKHTYDDGMIDDEMEHLYNWLEDGDKIFYYPANDMELVDTEQNGKKAFLLRSYLGDKWCAKSVDWKLEYVSGEWKITGVYQADPLRVKVGTKYSTDLDGDKITDKIYYETRVINENDSIKEQPVIKINDIVYDYKYLQDRCGVSISNPSNEGFYIIDLVTEDNYRELAILDKDIDNELVSHFFRYNGADLEYCGYVTDWPDSGSFFNQGKGRITAKKRLDILQGWSGFTSYKLNEKGVFEEEKDYMYYGLQAEADVNITYYAKSDLSLYMAKNRSSETVMIKEGESIRLIETDNKCWIYIISETGIDGWVYLDNDKLVLPSGEGKLEELITNFSKAN